MIITYAAFRDTRVLKHNHCCIQPRNKSTYPNNLSQCLSLHGYMSMQARKPPTSYINSVDKHWSTSSNVFTRFTADITTHFRDHVHKAPPLRPNYKTNVIYATLALSVRA